MHFAPGDHDRATALVELVGDVHLVERRDDRATVALADIREKNPVVGLLEPGAGRDSDGDDRGHRDHEQDFLLTSQA